ncbi:MAG: IS66 family transposase [Myxococcota bacterium]
MRVRLRISPLVHFFTAVADCDHVLFAYTERHTQEAVRKLFGEFKGFLQCDARNVYDILDRGPPRDEDDGVTLVGHWAHARATFSKLQSAGILSASKGCCAFVRSMRPTTH